MPQDLPHTPDPSALPPQAAVATPRPAARMPLKWLLGGIAVVAFALIAVFHDNPGMVAAVAVGAVVIILFAGLWNMIRGGDSNRSQMLMRARVIAQAVAIAVMLGAMFLFGQAHH